MENLSVLRASWPGWADFLHQRGLEDLAAWALEAAGPLAVLGAQAIYFGKPLLRPALSDSQMEMLVHLLEDREEAKAFVTYLRKGEQA